MYGFTRRESRSSVLAVARRRSAQTAQFAAFGLPHYSTASRKPPRGRDDRRPLPHRMARRAEREGL